MSSVLDATLRSLSGLPAAAQDSPAAALALALAKEMDAAPSAALSRELSRVLEVLAESQHPSRVSALDEVAAARAARKAASGA